jgi:hypothetical protein
MTSFSRCGIYLIVYLIVTELVGLYGNTVIPAPKRKCDLKLSAVVFPRPQWDEKENDIRCKNNNCKGKTSMYCMMFI